jgi:hypothetical protein
MLDEGIWLLWVDLDRIKGLTALAVDADGKATPLSGDGDIYLFPTRSGLAWTLTGSRASFLTKELQGLTDGAVPLKPRQQRKAADMLRKLITEVDTRVTWR